MRSGSSPIQTGGIRDVCQAFPFPGGERCPDVAVHSPGGGPPRLCLPVDGVTSATANQCADRIAQALGERAVGKVVVRENDKQWYVLFHYDAKRVTLAELDQALKGSAFSIPRDKLRLFGHVMLEIKRRRGRRAETAGRSEEGEAPDDRGVEARQRDAVGDGGDALSGGPRPRPGGICQSPHQRGAIRR